VIGQPDIPHNFEAEQALLGAILVNNGTYHRVSEFLRPEHFTDPLHGRLYDSISRLIDRGQAVNPVVLRTYAERDDDLQRVGGNAYIAELASASVHMIDAIAFGRLVHDLYLRRKLIEIGEDLVAKAYRPSPEIEAVGHIEDVERSLYALADSGSFGEAKTFSALLTEAVKEAELAHQRQTGTSGIATGFKALDDLLGGLHKSDLVILAARPAMGKSSLAANIGFNAAQAYRQEEREGQQVVVDGAAVVIFSLEMSGTQITHRIMAEQAEVPHHKVRKGGMSNAEMDRYFDAVTQLQHLPLYVDDTPALTISALRTRARRLKRQHGVGLIIVDYLQMLRGSTNVGDGRVQEVSEISRGLKALAKELDIPVLALSQLSRAVENRTDKRPQLADLRDSGTIEQDADVVMFIYRDEYYLEQSAKKGSPEHIASMGLAEVNIAKQRHGPTGTIPMRFNGAYTKFSDMGGANA
jgi:replicative DNA helicase